MRSSLPLQSLLLLLLASCTAELQADTDGGRAVDAGAPALDDAATPSPPPDPDGGSVTLDDGGPPSPPPMRSPFVSVDADGPEGPRFMVDGEPFYFAGTNLFWLVQHRTYGNDSVSDALDATQELGLRVIRVWGFADGDDWTTPGDPAIMQSAPGELNEDAFEALDWVIAEAGRRELRVILPLVNYWRDFGGMLQYAEWAGGSGYEFFYTAEDARALYRQYLTAVLTRVNTVTGVVYRDDPTIMAWELANEAHADFDTDAERGVLVDWYAQMAAHLRSLDEDHLIATGEEGFDVDDHRGEYDGAYANDWVLRGEAGTSYADNTSLPDIDFGGAHLYPDAWGFADAAAADGRRWIVDHARIAHDMGKPFVLGEYGNSDRSVYEQWGQAGEDEHIAGTLLWQLTPVTRGAGSDMEIVYPTDGSLVDALRAHAAHMNAR